MTWEHVPLAVRCEGRDDVGAYCVFQPQTKAVKVVFKVFFENIHQCSQKNENE